MNRQLEIIWAAGVLEGEGSFGLTSKGTKRSAKGLRYPLVQVSQTKGNYLMLERLQALWGGSITKEYKPKNTNWAPSRHWSIACQKALVACKELLACGYFEGRAKLGAQQIVTYYEFK